MAGDDTFRLCNPPTRGLGFDNTLETPEPFFALVDRDFGPFDLDVCASAETTKCAKFFTVDDNCLLQEWGPVEEQARRGKGIVTRPTRAFLNPPYSENFIGAIIKKALDEALAGRCSTMCLFPMKKSEHAWFHEYVLNPGGTGASAIYPVRGRIDFWRDGMPLGNPNHASVLVGFKVGHVSREARWWYRLPAIGSYHRTRGLDRGRRR